MNIAPFIDIKLVPSAGAELTPANLQAIAAQTAAVIAVQRQGNPASLLDVTRRPMYVGNGTIRYFLTGSLTTGVYTVSVLAGAWHDSANVANRADSYSFEVVTPTATVAGPFAGDVPSVGNAEVDTIDVNVLNSQKHGGAVLRRRHLHAHARHHDRLRLHRRQRAHRHDLRQERQHRRHDDAILGRGRSRSRSRSTPTAR